MVGGTYYTPESILHDYLILMTPGCVVTRWPLAVVPRSILSLHSGTSFLSFALSFLHTEKYQADTWYV